MNQRKIDRHSTRERKRSINSKLDQFLELIDDDSKAKRTDLLKDDGRSVSSAMPHREQSKRLAKLTSKRRSSSAMQKSNLAVPAENGMSGDMDDDSDNSSSRAGENDDGLPMISKDLLRQAVRQFTQDPSRGYGKNEGTRGDKNDADDDDDDTGSVLSMPHLNNRANSNPLQRKHSYEPRRSRFHKVPIPIS
uniref:Uncharacterized protein n=1 Tax=Craspedostauros australis TaxID=1486917 RepID=A0A7R9WN92_9STRA